jgi:hypothetical protein
MDWRTVVASTGFSGLAGLHVMWASGSSWPLPDKASLSDAVIGHDIGVLAARGILGLAGMTHLISPRSSSPRFRRLDRRVYAPLCLTLAALAAPAARRCPRA